MRQCGSPMTARAPGSAPKPILSASGELARSGRMFGGCHATPAPAPAQRAVAAQARQGYSPPQQHPDARIRDAERELRSAANLSCSAFVLQRTTFSSLRCCRRVLCSTYLLEPTLDCHLQLLYQGYVCCLFCCATFEIFFLEYVCSTHVLTLNSGTHTGSKSGHKLWKWRRQRFGACLPWQTSPDCSFLSAVHCCSIPAFHYNIQNCNNMYKRNAMSRFLATSN